MNEDLLGGEKTYVIIDGEPLVEEYTYSSIGGNNFEEPAKV